MIYTIHGLFLFIYLAGQQLAAAETITDFLRGRPDLSEVRNPPSSV
jgi:hypothetical protein